MEQTRNRIPKAIAAIVGAVIMILIAVLIRGFLDSDQGSSITNQVSFNKDGADLIYCSTEISLVCDTYREDTNSQIIVESPGKTLERLSNANAQELEKTIWIVSEPWPEILNAERERLSKNNVTSDSAVLGQSDLSLAIWEDRQEVLEQYCLSAGSKSIDFDCLSEASGKDWAELGGSNSWGKFKLGHRRSDEFTDGLLAITLFTQNYFDETKFASNDFDSQFRNWFSTLERSMTDFSPSAGSPIDEALLIGSASNDAVIVIDAEVRTKIELSRQKDGLKLVPLGSNKVRVFAVTIAGAELDSVEKEIESIMKDQGWETPGEGISFPSAGVLSALIDQWEKSI